MLKFRSPLLTSIPSPQQAHKTASMRRRILITLPCLILMGVAILLVAWRIPSTDGPLRFLYMIHDTGYLWLKGNLYYRFYPESLIGLGILTTLGSVNLIWLLAGWSKTRKLQIFFIRWATHHHRIHPLWRAGTSLCRKLGLPQELLDKTIRYDWQMALFQLQRSDPQSGSADLCDHLVHLIRFNVSLHQMDLSDPHTLSDTIADVYHTLLVIRYFGPQTSRRVEQSVRQLSKILFHIIADSPSFAENSQSLNLLTQPSAISLPQIQTSLLYICCLGDTDLALELPDKNLTQLAGESFRMELVHRLVSGVTQRMEILNILSNRFQTAVFRYQMGSRGEMPDMAWPPFPGKDANLHAIGRLTLDLAMDMAMQCQVPDLVLECMETVETLSLVTDLAVQHPNTSVADMAQLVRQLVTNLPQPVHYRMAGLLCRHQCDHRKHQWDASPLARDGIIRPRDILYEQLWAESILRAAGPMNGDGK